jgi:hypothetical protein
MKHVLRWFFLCCLAPILHASINTHIETSTVSIDDSFRLTLTLDAPKLNERPDLTPLQRDFNIEGTEYSASTRIINGQSMTESQWSFMLSPKKTGVLIIPEIRIGKQHSTASLITVTEEPTATETKSPDSPPPSGKLIQLKTITHEHEPYINQQMLYTVKLYHRAQLLNADYQPPQLEDALIIPLSHSPQYQTTHQGQRYAVEEQHYAIFPQKSGQQTLMGPSFQAVIYNGRPQRVRTSGKSIELKVKPVPSSYTATHWLPAKDIALTERYEHAASTLDEGSTIVRTITLKGTAIPAELLPTLSTKPQRAFSVYPEKPILNNTIEGHDVVGEKILKINYLLNQSGTITLPPYALTWFNTQTGKEQITSLPARTLHIVAKAAPVSPQQPAIGVTDKAVDPTPTTPLRTSINTQLPWILAALFAIAWIMTLIFARKSPSQKIPKVQKVQKAQKIKSKHHALQNACLHHDPIEARMALLSWAKQRWPNQPINHLDDLMPLINTPELQMQVKLLSKALYSKNQHWQGEQLWQLIHSYKERAPQHKKKQNLPPINPSTRKD